MKGKITISLSTFRLFKTQLCYILRMAIPEIVYHYCSVEAMLGIVENKSLWLSNSRTMNDAQEGKWITTLLRTRARELSLSNELFKYLEVFDEFSEPLYLCCFSKNGDLLSQWRGYAQNGTGVAIGFDLTELSIPEIQPNVRDGLFLTSVEYMSDQQNPVVDALLKLIHDEITIRGANYTSLYRHGKISAEMAHLVARFKNNGFYEEDEYRIVLDLETSAWPKNRNTSRRFRSQNGIVKDYFPRGFPKSALKTIVLGPKCELNTYILQVLLHVNGYIDDVPFPPGDTPSHLPVVIERSRTAYK